MKKNRTLLIVALVAIVAAIVLYGYREYNRKPAALDAVAADISAGADELMKEYAANENDANKKYLGKVVEVKGIIASIDNQQDTLVNILLGDKESMAHVSCSMSSQALSSVKSMKPGTVATIRGICTGYLMDVELNRCVLIK